MPHDMQSEFVLRTPRATVVPAMTRSSLAAPSARPPMADLLQPVLVSAFGRSGSTALMALLDQRPKLP